MRACLWTRGGFIPSDLLNFKILFEASVEFYCPGLLAVVHGWDLCSTFRRHLCSASSGVVLPKRPHQRMPHTDVGETSSRDPGQQARTIKFYTMSAVQTKANASKSVK